MNSLTGPYFMGIDFGTGGVRVGILDTGGHILAESEEFYDTYYPRTGWAEQKPSEWWQAFLKAAHTCLDVMEEHKKQRILACCVCATSSTVVPVDRQGKPLLDALLWMDARSSKEAAEINRTKHPVLKYCGGEVSSEWIVPKALWLKKHESECYSKSDKLVEQLDWINFMLTGNWAASICNATCKCNYVDVENGWNDDYFRRIGLEDYTDKLLLDVKKIGEPLGKLRKELATALGLNQNVTVVQGGIDAHMAVLGLGVANGDKVGTIMGTSFVHIAFSKNPVFQNGIWGPYHNAVLPNRWLLEGGQISAGAIVKWFKKTFEVKGTNPYDVLSEEASKVPVGSDGVIALDYFQGNRTPYKDPNAKGVFYGLSLKHTRAEMFRAVLESVAFGTKNIFDNFENQGCSIKAMNVCGGITKDPVWMQIIADVTGKPIVTTRNLQSGILGCCIAASVGMKIHRDFTEASKEMVVEAATVEPNTANTELYREVYDRYLDLYRSLKHMMK